MKKNISFNFSSQVYLYKIDNKFISKFKSGYYLEVLTPETIKLLKSIEQV